MAALRLEMEKRRATNTYSAVLSPLRFSPVVRVHDPFLPICRFEHLSSSLVPSSRSFMPLSSSRSIPVSLSRRLIPPHFNVARCNLYVRFTIGVLRGCHCFIDESWLYNEALPFFFPLPFVARHFMTNLPAVPCFAIERLDEPQRPYHVNRRVEY